MGCRLPLATRMSQLTRFWSRFFLKASLLRTYAETLLLFMLLVLFTVLVYQSNTGYVTATSLIFLINPLSALYYSLRTRIPSGRWYRHIGLDVLWLIVPALILNIVVWLTARTLFADMLANSDDLRLIDILFIALMAFPYVFFRVAIRCIIWWNDLRQRRVIWSLVSSNLVAVALLQALIVLPMVLLFFSNFIGNSFIETLDTSLAQWLYRLQMALPLVGLAILVATAVLIALLPVSIAVSYFFARGIRRRLDVLLDAAHAARDGNYGMQIRVSGQDEIARLQADFNVMTANLKINIDELRDEREKVATLLKNRRELMANVSHELRTPIATVSAYLESALRQQENRGDITLSQHDLAVIQRETLRLQTLIDDLFALSRAEVEQLAVNAVPVDSIDLIQRIIETVAPLAWRVNRVELVAHLPTWLPKVVADGARLEQALRNLILNSLRHTAPGGLIIIRAREVNGCAEIQAQDTGEGIQPAHLPHIWERYYRDAENGGTGLGLALVKSFIEAMHGQVAVTSTPGEGACFTITLPLVNASSESLPKPVPVTRPWSAKSTETLR
jgi:signal transduction histidine kinase